MSLSLSFFCSFLTAVVVKAGSHRQGVEPEGCRGSQGRSFRPDEGQGLGRSAFSDRFQGSCGFCLDSCGAFPRYPHPVPVPEAVDVGPLLTGRW